MLLIETRARPGSRRRRSIAEGLERAVAQARGPRRHLDPAVPVDRADVLPLAPRLLAIAVELRCDRPVPADAVDAAHRLLTDGAGPLDLEGGLEPAVARIERLLGLA